MRVNSSSVAEISMRKIFAFWRKRLMCSSSRKMYSSPVSAFQLPRTPSNTAVP